MKSGRNPEAAISTSETAKPVSKVDDLRQRFRTAPWFGASKVCKEARLWGQPSITAQLPTEPSVPGSTVGQHIYRRRTLIMRSDLVFGALSHVSNRYALCQLASKATRMLHKPNTRLQDTTNEVLGRFHSTNPASPAAVAVAKNLQVQTRRAA
jgi:hypothetical protein